MRKELKREDQSKLDPSRLLGFRNLATVAPAEKDVRKSSELAFNKIGTETNA